jgi:chromosomal replication initiator protein
MAEPARNTQVRRITIEATQKAVAEHFGLNLACLRQKNNSRPVVIPRQIAMYLARHLNGASFPQIGLRFGSRHHTTVMHAINKIERQRRTDRDLATVLNVLEASLQASPPENDQINTVTVHTER